MLIKKLKLLPKFLELTFRYVKLESIPNVFISKLFLIPRRIKFKDGEENYFTITFLNLFALPYKEKLVDERDRIYSWLINNKRYYATIIQASSLVSHLSKKDNYEYKAADYKNKKVLDVGGHVGDSAMYFLDNGAKFVDIYEPVELNIKVMKMNLQSYPSKKYKINPFAVGDKEEKLTIKSVEKLGSPGFGSDLSVLTFFKPEVSEYTFNCISFRKILKENSYDIAKIDCEGCEEFLINLEDELIKKIPVWFIETHSKEIEKAILEKFRKLGFKVTLESKVSKEVAVYKFELPT
ncbi:MAG: FkbM family methyltransferase [Candidatus Anstonellaceae archaeon]